LNDENEANVLIQMIHVAVQSRGLDAAEAGFNLASRIKVAVEASRARPEDDEIKKLRSEVSRLENELLKCGD